MDTVIENPVSEKITFYDLTDQEAQLLWNSLADRPAKEVYPLLKKLEQQLIKQGRL